MFQFFLSPKGRFRRRDYWFGMAVMLLVLGLGLGADYVLRGVEFVPTDTPGDYTMVPGPFYLGIAGLLVLWPSIAMGIKRWHDRDRAWWWVLLGVIPIVNLYAYFCLLFLGGSPHINQFGENPREDDRSLHIRPPDTSLYS